MQEELFDLFPDIDKSRVYVCHHGLRSVFFQPPRNNDNLIPLGLKPFSYFLFVGNMERRKNLPFLISQFIEARSAPLLIKTPSWFLSGN